MIYSLRIQHQTAFHSFKFIRFIQNAICLTNNNIMTSLELTRRCEYGFVFVFDTPHNGWQYKCVKLNHSSKFFPSTFHYSYDKKKKRFPEMCFLDRRSLVVLNVTLSMLAWERRLWMMLNVLWHPAFVSVLPRAALRLRGENLVYCTTAGSDSVGGTRRLATLNIWGALFQNVMYQPGENVSWSLLLKISPVGFTSQCYALIPG